jgi:hypothetical protein
MFDRCYIHHPPSLRIDYRSLKGWIRSVRLFEAFILRASAKFDEAYCTTSWNKNNENVIIFDQSPSLRTLNSIALLSRLFSYIFGLWMLRISIYLQDSICTLPIEQVLNIAQKKKRRLHFCRSLCFSLPSSSCQEGNFKKFD